MTIQAAIKTKLVSADGIYHYLFIQAPGKSKLFIEWKVEERRRILFQYLRRFIAYPSTPTSFLWLGLTLTNYLFGARCSSFRDVIFAHWTRSIAWTHIYTACISIYTTHMPDTPVAFYCKSTKKFMFILFPGALVVLQFGSFPPPLSLAHTHKHNNPCLLPGDAFCAFA